MSTTDKKLVTVTTRIRQDLLEKVNEVIEQRKVSKVLIFNIALEEYFEKTRKHVAQ